MVLCLVLDREKGGWILGRGGEIVKRAMRRDERKKEEETSNKDIRRKAHLRKPRKPLLRPRPRARLPIDIQLLAIDTPAREPGPGHVIHEHHACGHVGHGAVEDEEVAADLEDSLGDQDVEVDVTGGGLVGARGGLGGSFLGKCFLRCGFLCGGFGGRGLLDDSFIRRGAGSRAGLSRGTRVGASASVVLLDGELL